MDVSTVGKLNTGPNEMARVHLRSHTGLRGIAALMVAPVHMYCDEFVKGFDKTVMPYLNSVLAVDIFFVLSGFILPFVYHDSEGRMNATWKRFFGARFARIYPLHLLTIAIVGVMILTAIFRSIPMGRPYYLSDLPPQLLLVHAFPFIEKWAWIHPSWSISMEFLAYVAIFPPMTLLFRRRRSLHAKAVLIAGLCGLYGFTYWFCERSGGNAAMGWYAVGRVAAGFGIGFLLFKVHQENPETSFRIQSHRDVILLLFGAAYIASCIGLFRFQWLIVMIPILVLSLTSNEPSLATRVLGNRIMVWLGTISYSVYMIHTIFGKMVAGLSNRFPTPSPLAGGLMLGGMFAILLLASTISYWLFENPARKRITAWWEGNTSKAR